MPINMHGRWRLQVIEAIHTWENRFVVAGASTGNGAYTPDIGRVVHVDGLPTWELRGEHIDPSNPGVWQASDMARLSRTQNGAELTYIIGAEDPLPTRDFKDIQWDARFQGKMIDLPYRPYAVRVNDLFQMPDGVFETALGQYYMGVRVMNTWGEPLSATDVLDISSTSRVDLAARGIQVLDGWAQAELASFGQQQLGRGMVIGPLQPGASRTVYFKVDVSGASPRKHMVEFVCLNMAGTPDPNNDKRRATKAIFVSRSYIDSVTKEIVSEVRQGTLRMKLKEFAFDREGARKGRKRRGTARRPDDAPTLQEIRDLLNALLSGRRVDPCRIQRVLTCYCQCRDDGGGSGGGHEPPGDGRFVYDPFYAIPTKFALTITPREPYEGQYGPIPFDDPWWKVLLLILAFFLFLAGLLEEAADAAYHDNALVIGTLERWQQNDVDAALCKLDTDRALSFLQVLDAQSDEDNQLPVSALDGVVVLNNPPLTSAEITTFLTLATTHVDRKVFKSGATTGLTHGIMNTFVGAGHNKATWSLPLLQIVPDPAFGNMNVSAGGDSGSVWVHSNTQRPVALHHTGNSSGADMAIGTLLTDVMNALNITF